VAAVVISVIALMLSLASLSWQAWSWLRSGPVLRVQVTNILADSGRTSAYGNSELENYVEVTVINHGRAAATINTWGIRMPSGENMFVIQPIYFSERLPARVEPHASLSLHVEADELRKHSARHGIPFKAMRPWVQSATGKKVYAKSLFWNRGVPLD
jgi:hypothetical protein